MNSFSFHGGPTWLEWVAGLCDKVNELITAVNTINKDGVKNPHKLTFTGDVDATYDGSEDVTVDISGGGGGGESDKLWYPYIVEKVLNWRKTTSTTTPTPFDLTQLKGDTGSDGYSPTANVKQTATGATITITDKTGTTTATVKNGTDGTDGTNGSDGFSPSAKVTPTADGARITITDKEGTTTADVTNGVDGSDGAAAGFGTVDATATIGTEASATVTTDGPDTAKNMHFNFTYPSGGGGTGDVTAAGNNTFSGANKFTGRVDFESNVYLGDNTHVSTPTANENATNKLYVDTLAGTTQSTAETNAKNYTDEQIAGAIGVGDTTTLEPGNNATVTESVVGGVHKFSFGVPKGEKGDMGPAGPYTDIEIGTVTTGEPGTDAEATFDTTTQGVALLDLKIPRGNPGKDGTDGTTGATGPAGAAAGFGVVDATATTGTTAGATVTTDGPDTAKNMHFAFTIPAGGGGGAEVAYKRIICNLSYSNDTTGTIEASSALVTVYGRIVVVQGKFYTSSTDSISGLKIKPKTTGDTLPELDATTTIFGYPIASGFVSKSEGVTYNAQMYYSNNSYILSILTFLSSLTITAQAGQSHTMSFIAIGFTKE